MDRIPMKVRSLTVVLAAAIAVGAFSGSAASEATIALHGPDSPSHLRLTLSGGDLVVSGGLKADELVGLRFRRRCRSVPCVWRA